MNNNTLYKFYSNERQAHNTRRKRMEQKTMWVVINKKRGKLLHVCYAREDAREFKAMCGGKAKGITIIKYVPVAEIR